MTTIELNDQFTGEWTVYKEATLQYDETTPITASDDILYKELDGKFFRRVLVDDTVNVKWFGAKGDGQTDDSEAIKDAIDSFHSIKFDPGTYIVNSTINIPMEFSGLSIMGSGSDLYNKNSTIISTNQSGTILKGEKGLNFFKISNLIFDGKLKPEFPQGLIAMDFIYGGGLFLDRIIVRNFRDFGLRTEDGLYRVENCFFTNNGTGAQIFSDSSISNSEFTGGNTPLRLAAGGNRLTNVWCNSGKETCLEITPLSLDETFQVDQNGNKTPPGHQNTSITNLYIGEVVDNQTEKFAINIAGNDNKRVQQVQISNSFFVHAANTNSINGLIKISKADEIILNGINVLGQGLYATSYKYTSHFVKGENTNRVIITSSVINGINKNAIYQGSGCYDWEILNNTFNNCGDTVAQGDEGANIYVSENVARTSIIGNKFLVSSNSNTPYAAYVTSTDTLNWDNNYISYPSSIIIKDHPTSNTNTFAGSYYRNGSHFKIHQKLILEQSCFQNGITNTRPTNNLQNAQFFYDNDLKKPIWYDESSASWRDSLGTIV